MSFQNTVKVLGVCLAFAGLNGTSQAQLTSVQTELIPVMAYAAKGDEAKLKLALNRALTQGVTINEAKAAFVQLYAYAGFPRSLTALNTLLNLTKERKAQGLVDREGKEPTKKAKGIDIRALGTATQTKLVGAPVKAEVYTFCPEIDTYLKEHLFGDIFANDVLDWKTREVLTVSTLAALPAPTQLRSHLRVALNTGLTGADLQSFVEILRKTVGKSEADLAQKTLDNVMKH